MEKAKLVTVKEASQVLGMTEQAVRIRIERGLLPIGKCFPPLNGGKRNVYYIYEEWLEEYLRGER